MDAGLQSPASDSVEFEYMDDATKAALETEIRPSLPTALRPDGRPAWEPPILDYSKLIDLETYEKKREAILKFTNGDRARTTAFMDSHAELELLGYFAGWCGPLQRIGDHGSRIFFHGLFVEISRDLATTNDEHDGHGLWLWEDLGGGEWTCLPQGVWFSGGNILDSMEWAGRQARMKRGGVEGVAEEWKEREAGIDMVRIVDKLKDRFCGEDGLCNDENNTLGEGNAEENDSIESYISRDSDADAEGAESQIRDDVEREAKRQRLE